MERGDGKLLGSSPKTVAKKIVKTALVNTPRARYPVGKGAGTIMRARKVLPDVAFDAIVTRMYLK